VLRGDVDPVDPAELEAVELARRVAVSDLRRETLLRLESLAGVEQLTDAELLWLSRHLFDRGDANGALRYVQPLVEGRPNATAAARAEALFLAGRALRAKGELDAAEQALGQVIAMGAGFDLDARLELAKVVADRGNLEQAMAELSGLISSEVSEIAAESLYTAAMIQRRIAAQHRRTENHAGVVEANNEARKLLKRLVLLYPFEQVEPLPQLSYLELAEIEAELNELDAAAQELRELVAKYPDGAYATYAKAVLAADEKHYGDAVALLKTLQAKPQDPRLSARIEALLRVLERN
jgi:predicted negative regulator of RcsB-dependent stress response